MSEASQAPTLEQLKSTLNTLAFIHQKMVTTSFYPEEFKQADQALRMIIELAEKVGEDIKAAEPAPEKQEKEVVSE